MKKIYFTTTFLLTSFILFSQTSGDVDVCSEMQGKPIITGEDMLLFNLTGVNLSNYNWDNPDVNCHINSVITAEKKRRTDGILCGLTLGLASIPLGIGLAQSIYGDDAGGMYLLTALCVGGGIYFAIDAGKNKKLRDYHLNEVSDYYRVNRLNNQ